MAGEVVGAGVDGNAAAEDGVGAMDLDVFVDALVHGVAAGVGFEVAEVADVAFVGHRPGVVVAVGIEVASGGGAVVGGDVTEFMDMEAVLRVRLEPVWPKYSADVQDSRSVVHKMLKRVEFGSTCVSKLRAHGQSCRESAT